MQDSIRKVYVFTLNTIKDKLRKVKEQKTALENEKKEFYIK